MVPCYLEGDIGGSAGGHDGPVHRGDGNGKDDPGGSSGLTGGGGGADGRSRAPHIHHADSTAAAPSHSCTHAVINAADGQQRLPSADARGVGAHVHQQDFTARYNEHQQRLGCPGLPSWGQARPGEDSDIWYRAEETEVIGLIDTQTFELEGDLYSSSIEERTSSPHVGLTLARGLINNGVHAKYPLEVGGFSQREKQ